LGVSQQERSKTPRTIFGKNQCRKKMEKKNHPKFQCQFFLGVSFYRVFAVSQRGESENTTQKTSKTPNDPVPCTAFLASDLPTYPPTGVPDFFGGPLRRSRS
jgi:hypothetical protein